MKYSILGFNQEKVINNEFDIDLIDLTLLDYVCNACSRPSMMHTFDENKQPYVWLKHSKILEDLPILGIGEEALKKRLKNLVDIGLLKVIVTSVESKGRRAYYTISQTCEELRYNNQVYQNTLDNEQSSVPKYTSDNTLNKDNKLNNDNTIVLSSDKPKEKDTEDFFNTTPLIDKPKKKRGTLYSNCMALIDEFTIEEDVKNLLRDYLKIRLERKDIPFGKASFNGMLKKLRTLTTSKAECLKIIQQSIDRNYPTFYPLNKPRYSRGCPELIEQSNNVSITTDELEEALEIGEKF